MLFLLSFCYYTALFTLAFLFSLTLVQRFLRPRKKNTLLAVVLGDTGHSPRILAHCTAAQTLGYGVDESSAPTLLGYDQSPVHSDAANIPIVNVVPFPKSWQPANQYLSFVFRAIFNALALTYAICIKSFYRNYDTVILQVPPAIPTIAVLVVLKHVCGFKFVIDWHNYGWSIMKCNQRHETVVRVSEVYEFFFGRFADFHFTVTKAMKKDLIRRGFDGSKIAVLYDKPGTQFRLAVPNPEILGESDRPIVVSSTSWTKDEDFDILYKALEIYDTFDATVPIRMVITGKGPEKAFYQQKINAKIWRNIEFIMPWLEADDYPKVLAEATLGVCLHKSSSGLDLPMKVVDMLGAGTPVLAFGYNCIDELVQAGHTGEIFNSHEELAAQLLTHLTTQGISEKYQRGITDFRKEENSWLQLWEDRAAPAIFC